MHYEREGVVPSKKGRTERTPSTSTRCTRCAKLVTDKQLPPKVLIVHRWTRKMVSTRVGDRARPARAGRDGHGRLGTSRGSSSIRIATTRSSEPVQFTGFKLFFHHDLRERRRAADAARAAAACSPRPISHPVPVASCAGLQRTLMCHARAPRPRAWSSQTPRTRSRCGSTTTRSTSGCCRGTVPTRSTRAAFTSPTTGGDAPWWSRRMFLQPVRSGVPNREHVEWAAPRLDRTFTRRRRADQPVACRGLAAERQAGFT